MSWCYKVIESPTIFSTARGGKALVRTMDHNMYKIEDGDLFGKISPNNSDNPQHILHSQFKTHSAYQTYQYFTWSPITHHV